MKKSADFKFFVFLQKNSKKMNYKTSILGRRHEQDLIREYYESPKPELVAVYGRRRVGKTYLVKQFFDNDFELQSFINRHQSLKDIYASKKQME